MTSLDWSGGGHWNRGRRLPCRWCGQPSFLTDEYGVPAHKACAEIEDRDRANSVREAPHLDDTEWGAA